MKHQLLCQILFRSQERQVGNINEAGIHTLTHTVHMHTTWVMQKHTHTQAFSLTHIFLPPDSVTHLILHTYTQIHIHPRKQFFFFFLEREKSGAERGVEHSSLANVHNEKCKLCHFLADKSVLMRAGDNSSTLISLTCRALALKHSLPPFRGPLSI